MDQSAFPWKRVVAWGLVLTMIWEFGQCVFLYDMWAWGLWQGTLWMRAAIFGDVPIVIGVVSLAGRLVGRVT